MTRMAIIDDREITVTPVFKIMEIENVPKSEKAGYPVMEVKEMVEVRFAGSKNYSPVFPAHAMWQRDPTNGNRVITYAERWADQYQAFKEGNPQEAMGTPLEMLRQYGVTPEQLSLCRAVKVYSIEALDKMQSPEAVKALGMHANKLREAARKFLATRNSTSAAMDEIEALKAEIAALKAAGASTPPVKEPTPDEIAAAQKAADKSYAEMSDDDIKAKIKEKTGAAPRGTPTRDTLERLLSELEAA
ncbi:hypothetical protein [Sphingopyxis sp. 113P3]|uniref:hypothetical protein n=1 Tax=Sphingopyxis sp. (strain 113P3) TaxID=292913 RepID=UPI0006AD5E3D|nr:hypothetical protein [Sphingopyxis sp. 113P3]ALC11217.1 hypothetical protein LH20_04550 [Sphingopyxis sp. 113P3]